VSNQPLERQGGRQMARIIEQGTIRTSDDISKLQILNWSRLNGYWDNNPARVMQFITGWLMNKATYTIAHVPLRTYPALATWPSWKQGGRQEELGRLFWNSFLAAGTATLTFFDKPDFEGSLQTDSRPEPFQVYGDIGKVSASTFALTLARMREGDLWISVLDEETQVILELLFDLHDAVASFLDDLVSASEKEEMP
jgi:hypothetical protein